MKNQEKLKKFVEDNIIMNANTIMELINYRCQGEPLEFINEFDEEKQEYQEILEFWLVNEYFFEELKSNGEPVVKYQDLYIWGRNCSGQAIYMDSIIEKICGGK